MDATEKNVCNGRTSWGWKDTEGSGSDLSCCPAEGVDGALCFSLPPSSILTLEGIRKGKGERDDSAVGWK